MLAQLLGYSENILQKMSEQLLGYSEENRQQLRAMFAYMNMATLFSNSLNRLWHMIVELYFSQENDSGGLNNTINLF